MLEETKHRIELLKETITDMIEIVECGDVIRFHMEASQFKIQVSRLNREAQVAAASSENPLLQTSARFANQLHSRAQKSLATSRCALEPGQTIRLKEDFHTLKNLLEALDFTIALHAKTLTATSSPNSAPF